MNKIKNLSIVVAFCMMTLLIFGGNSVNASAAQADPKETVIKASQKLLSFKNYRMTMDTTTSMAIQGKNVISVMKGEFDIQVNPLLGRNNMDITTYVDLKIINNKFMQYLEQSGDQIIIYTNVDNQWMKQSLPKAIYNPLKDYDNYFKAIKSVTVISDDANATVFEVVADGNYMKEELKRNLALVGMQKMQLTDDFLKDLSDLTYDITIDKKTGLVSKIEMDLSDFLSEFGNHLAETMPLPDDKKMMLKEMFNNMNMVMSATFSKFDEVGKITIPQEARQAQEAKNTQKATSL